MKQKLLKYIIFTLILIFPLTVEAAIRMDCPGPVKKGTTITCKLYSDYPVTSFKGKLDLSSSSNITLNRITPKDKFINYSSGSNIVLNTNGVDERTEIADIILNVGNEDNDRSFTIIFSQVDYVQNGSTIHQSGGISERINYEVPPTTTTTTTTTRPSTTTSPQDEKTFTVTLIANNGTAGEVKGTCSTTGSNCKLDLNTITTPTRDGYKFNGWGNNATCTEGNKDTFTVTSDTSLYACWLEGDSNPIDGDSDIYLQELTIEGQEINFSKFKKEYELTVLYEVENLIINAIPVDESITVNLEEAYPLIVGDNTIEIKLTNDQDEESSYIIKVKRLNEGEEIRDISNDARLISLDIEGYNIDFDSATYEYNITIPKGVESLEVTPVLSSPYAKFAVSGNSMLEDGSVITVTVVAEDGTVNTYKVNITIEENFLENYLIYIIIGGVLLIGIIVLIIVNQPKKRKKQMKKEKLSSKAPKSKAQNKTSKVKSAPAVPIPVGQPLKPTNQNESLEVLD